MPCASWPRRPASLAPEDLTDLGRFELVTDDRGTFQFHAFVARTTLGDRDVECHEGRQMVFVDPDPVPDLDLVPSTALVAPALAAWVAEHPFVPAADQHRFAGVILVDRRGWVLLQERDEHPRDRPGEVGAAPAATSTRARTSSRRPTASSRRRPASGSRPATLELFGEFAVDHREAYGTWDRMQVFVAATDLTDADIDCGEGRQIVFVDPDGRARPRPDRRGDRIVPGVPRLADATHELPP